jgi:hypothetical protein
LNFTLLRALAFGAATVPVDQSPPQYRPAKRIVEPAGSPSVADEESNVVASESMSM